MQSENDVILTARPPAERRSCVCCAVGCDGVRVCGTVFEVPRLWDASVGEELPWEWYGVAVMRRSAIVVGHEPRKISLAISGRSAACSLFLADQ